jgi:hypothetical protein
MLITLPVKVIHPKNCSANADEKNDIDKLIITIASYNECVFVFSSGRCAFVNNTDDPT